MKTSRILLILSVVFVQNYCVSVHPLHDAVQKNDVARVKSLVAAGADVNFKNEHRFTALHFAVIQGNKEIAQILIDSGAQIVDSSNLTPFTLALVGGHWEIFQMFINTGLDVKAQETDGQTLLHIAATWGYKEIVHILLNIGEDPNAACDGWSHETPLHRAVDGGHAEVAHMLIQAGAYVDAQSRGGETPLHWAGTIREGGSVAKILLNAGAHIELKDNAGLTPLNLALRNRNYKVAHILICAGADPNSRDEKNITPLHHAARGKSIALVQTLLLAKANPNLQDDDGQTPLRYALLQADEKLGRKIIQILLDAGANPDLKDKNGCLQLSKEVRRRRMEEMMEEMEEFVARTD